MAFIYDLSDTWNNAGISWNGVKLNVTDSASAAGSKLLDLQIGGASKFTVGKTGALTATGLIESTVGGFKFPDGTTQTTKATVNSVSGTGTVNGLTLTGTVTDSGSLTLGGTLGNITNSQLTNSAITINGTSTALGGSISVGTVTSVAGTGTVSGLSLTGSVTTSGSLTLGGTLVLTSGQVTDALGFTPYNATNPTGYITASALTPYLTSATAATTYQPLDGDLTAIAALAGTAGLVRKTAANAYTLDTAAYITGITSSDVTTALGFTPYNATNPAGYTTNTGTVTNVTGAGAVSGLTLTGNVTTSGALTLGGALSLTSGDVTTGLGYTPYNATNPSGYLSTVSLTSNVTGTLPIANGGTGATTASGARTTLGLGTAAVLNAGVAGGVATLDGSGTVPTSQLPGAVLGGLNYQGTWNASTNTPTLASSTGSKGYYYVVSVAGSTNLNGITDWKIGDWAVYDGTTWQKVDNTDAVSSVNGYTGAVVLTTSDVAQGTNLYFTQAAARGSVSAGTGISYDSGTGVITNSAPDQTVALTGAGTTVVTGTYPNFTITSNDSTVGTVTSVAASGGTTGLSFTGSPITAAGTLTLGGTLALANGGTGATTASGARTALGLGTAATTDVSAYATAAQGTKADTAVQTIASTDGSVTITGTTAIDLSVAVAGSTSNVILPVRNTTGATLTKGTAVYISGATGQLSTVSKAIATGDATSAQTLGLVTANIANNANGNVTLIGTITNIDTSAYTDGAQLYLSPTTAGALTATKPYAPEHLVYMAVVESAHPSQGKLFVKVQNGYEMDELHNVSAQSPANNDGLFYNTSTNLWEKKSIVAALGYTPYNATNPAGYTTNTGTVTSVNLTAGTGVSVSGGPITSSGAITVTNTAPDQVVSLTGAGTTTITGTYPNFTVTSNDSATGTVTSVGGTGTVSGLTLTGSVTTSGNLTLGGTLAVTPSNFASQTANTVLAAPNGAAGVPTFRAIVAADIPTLNQNTTGTASNVTGTVAVGNGGTGATTLSSGYVLKGNGTSAVSASVIYDNGTNVGIGTASPANKLDVAGVIRSVSATFGNSDVIAETTASTGTGYSRFILKTTDREWRLINDASTSGSPFLLYDATAAATRLLIDNSGNVMVGGTSALQSAKITAYGSVAAQNGGVDGTFANAFVGVYSANSNEHNVIQTAVSSNGVGSGFRFKASDGGGASTTTTVLDLTRTQTIFYTGGSERARIDSSGNLLVGGTTQYGAAKVTITNAGAYMALNTTTVGYSLVRGFDNGTERWSIGQIGFGGADGMAFYTGTANTERMRIDSSGNVSITSSGNGTLTLGSSAGAYSSVLNMNSSAGGGSVITASQSFSVQTASTERMRIDGSGNVGIGTSSPGDTYGKLTVAGGIRTVDDTSSKLELGRYSAGAPNSYIKLGPNSASLRFTDAGDTADLMTLTNAGNLGIGTASPTNITNYKSCTLNGAAGSFSEYRQNEDYVFRVGSDSSTGGFLYHQGAFPIRFLTNNAERMRIASGGNVGIGNSDPGYRLDISAADTTAGLGYALRLRSNATATAAAIQFTDSPVTAQNGLIACTDTGILTLQGGDGGSAAVAFRTGGDERFKINNTGGITSSALADAVGYKGLPQNSQTASYTLALSDMGKHISITTGGVVIPANGSVAFPIGATIVVFNNSGSTQTISITSDTLRQAGTTNTGSRTLAVYGLATLVKVTSTVWVITGNVT